MISGMRWATVDARRVVGPEQSMTRRETRGGRREEGDESRTTGGERREKVDRRRAKIGRLREEGGERMATMAGRRGTL